MAWIYSSMALLAGMLLAIQAAINSQLGVALNQQPLTAALVSFLMGSLALFGMVLAQGNLGSLALMPEQPWWRWVGGLMGAFMVCATIVLAPKLGVANMLLFIIIGQLLSGMVIDHFGLLGMPVKPVDVSKLIGIGLMVLGLAVFMFGSRWLKR